GIRARSGCPSIGAAAGKITCFPSFLVCIGPHPPERISVFRSRPSLCGRNAFRLSLLWSSMCSEQLAVLDLRAPRDIGFGGGVVADIESAVAPHSVHDHRELARHRDHRLAMAGAFGDLLAPGLVL